MPVFISYSQKDEEIYNELRSDLLKEQVDCWDSKSMKVAVSLSDQLRKAIQECDTCVFLTTQNSLSSTWCSAETGAFWGAGKKVIVLKLDPNVQDAEIPPQFKGDLYAQSIQQVIKSIKEPMLPGPSISPGLLLFFDHRGARGQDKEKIEVIKNSVSVPFHEVGELQSLDNDNLSLWQGLFLGMPYGQKFTDSLINRLVEWVRNGGNLIVSCFELGERHHRTNLNELTYHFGIRFNSDVVVSPGPAKDPTNKGYGEPLLFNQFADPDDPLFRAVSEVVMRNACTLHLEPGALPRLRVSPNQIRELETESAHYSEEPDGFVLASGGQVFQDPYLDGKRAVIALAPKELTGNGRVLALGTWDFRRNGIKSDNNEFIRNLLSWLISQD